MKWKRKMFAGCIRIDWCVKTEFNDSFAELKRQIYKKWRKKIVCMFIISFLFVVFFFICYFDFLSIHFSCNGQLVFCLNVFLFVWVSFLLHGALSVYNVYKHWICIYAICRYGCRSFVLAWIRNVCMGFK